MNTPPIHSERERRDWIIVLVILLIGFLCIGMAGERAIRIAPFWRANANMRSNINPDSAFLSNRPIDYYEPLNPSILTPPPWLNIFLTPGVQIPTRPPVEPSHTPLPTNTPFPTLSPTATSTPTFFLLFPTSTPPIPIYTPHTRTAVPPTDTLSPTPTPLPTSTPTSIPVDVTLTKTDGSSTYTPGSPLVYTLSVTNPGPNDVNGAVLSDVKPPQVTLWGWCVAPCLPVAATSENLSAVINLPSGTSVTYLIQANTDPAATLSLSNTASISVPSGYTDLNPANNTATDTDTPLLSADLEIIKTDNATHYVAGTTKTYFITVTNHGPSNAVNASVTDIFSTNANIASVGWTCAGSGGATCTANGSGDINDTVNLPAGSSAIYTVTANISASASGDLVNTASVSSITDPNPANNSATDTDALIQTDPPPPDISTVDNVYYVLPAGNTLTLNINLDANGDPGPDVVFYEFSVAAIPPDYFNGILLDWIVIEISDGNNWYQVFNWGDNIPDTNTNADYTLLSLPPSSPLNPEEDQRRILSSDLAPYNTGIAIDIDSIVPPGTYHFIRFYAPTGDVDGQTEIDAISILP